MIDLDNTAELVPVSEWVYNLYRAEYWTENAADGGRKLKTIHLAACDSHVWADANEHVPNGCNCISVDMVKENVGKPRVIGQMYGQKVYESSLEHGKRLAPNNG